MNENTSSKKIIDDYTTKVRATNEIARSEARNKKREARETPIANVLKSTEEMPVQQRQITTEETPVQQRQKPQSVWNELGGLALKIALISIAFFLIFTFVYGFHRTTDSDMSPMIRTGDLVLFYRLNRDYT
ncbi:MAG: hypothetical protein FWD05_13015, partial [Oscillospiraceae bacterium]|nr:hypothetical protein [Oscillospiraceae bacterium]